jgi:hypothetical protein
MKMTYRTRTGRITFELEVPHGKAAFEVAAGIENLFGEEFCGCCKSTEIVHEIRTVTNGKYFQLRCMKCRAQLDFGQNKDNVHLFVKRWDKQSNAPMPNNGWYVYTGQGGGTSSAGGYGSEQKSPDEDYRRTGHRDQPAADNDPIPF